MRSAEAEQKYKTYKNKLSSILRNTETNYYTAMLEKQKASVKETWKILHVINKHKNKPISSILYKKKKEFQRKRILLMDLVGFETKSGPDPREIRVQLVLGVHVLLPAVGDDAVDGVPLIDYAVDVVPQVDHTDDVVPLVDHSVDVVPLVDQTVDVVPLVDHTVDVVQLVDHSVDVVPLVDHTVNLVALVDLTVDVVPLVDHTVDVVQLVDHTVDVVPLVDHSVDEVPLVDHGRRLVLLFR